MVSTPGDGYLKSNTLNFAAKMCQSINDMVGVSFTVKESSFSESSFVSSFKMITFISFSGTIQGNYLCSLDEAAALKIMGAFSDGMSEEQIREMRGDFSGFVKEVLNLSVGQSIVELEKNFGDLTFNPSTVVYGELEFPDFLSGNVLLESEHGNILCGFSLNLANLRIGQKLEEALVDLEKKTAEALEAQKNISSILELLPVGLVAIDQLGIILPGHSKSMKAVACIDECISITGCFLPDILKIDAGVGGSWKNWLDLVFKKFDLIPFKDLKELCEINEVKTNNGRILKLDWLPVIDNVNNILEKLLVVIEDITKQRELEKKMDELNKRHQENLELISQVININPDEVTNFIYDSSQLLTDAQRIVEGDSCDHEFVNELFRTFHTLKGSSGQFQFRALQEMAHKVEDHLRRYRNQTYNIDPGIISEVKTSIEDAKNYISRIKDIRTKLGGKEETLRQKADRDPNTIMVSSQDIDDLRIRCKRILLKSKNLIKDDFFIEEMSQCHDALCDLKRMKLSFFLSSLESLAKNSSEKVNKKVALSIAMDIGIEIEIIRAIHQCFIHLINNAIDHGIELPEERLKAGKIENGVIVISGKKENNSYIISFEDDGRGIDIPVVMEKIKSIYKMSQDEVAKLSLEELYSYLFKPGFTTCSTVTMLSGSGVGMDFVDHTLTKIGGHVKIKSEKGKGSIVTLIIPVPEIELQAKVN
ncbi:MAG: Hpt domain-containing protein [Chitinispirillaceae bacterium]|nr:Hpt domain-containing protein [Chitinispirillaceae bacterium]